MKEQHDLAKWLDGKMAPDELAAFEKSEGFRTYERIRTTSANLKPMPFDADAMYSRLITARSQKPDGKKRSRKLAFLRVAAVAAIAIGVYFAIFSPDVQKFETDNAKNLALNLPDGSEVRLNSKSELKYDNRGWKKNRKLELNGEAYFKVKKGETFEVATPNGSIRVLGTQFNVHSRNQRFEVSCFEGSVKVAYGAKTRILKPGGQIVVFEGEEIPSENLLETQPAWTQGNLRFASASFEEIIKELERRFDLTIKVSGTIKNATFTGLIPAQNPETALRVLGITYKFSHSIKGKTATLIPNA